MILPNLLLKVLNGGEEEIRKAVKEIGIIPIQKSHWILILIILLLLDLIGIMKALIFLEAQDYILMERGSLRDEEINPSWIGF